VPGGQDSPRSNSLRSDHHPHLHLQSHKSRALHHRLCASLTRFPRRPITAACSRRRTTTCPFCGLGGQQLEPLVMQICAERGSVVDHPPPLFSFPLSSPSGWATALLRQAAACRPQSRLRAWPLPANRARGCDESIEKSLVSHLAQHSNCGVYAFRSMVSAALMPGTAGSDASSKCPSHRQTPYIQNSFVLLPVDRGLRSHNDRPVSCQFPRST